MNHQPQPRKRSWLKLTLWIGIPLGILLVLCASPFVTLWVWSRGHAAETNRLVAEIEAKGEPIIVEWLPEHYPIDSGVEDVTALWLEAFVPFDSKEFKSSGASLPIVGNGDLKPPPLGENWEQLEACEAYLAANAASLQKIKEATSRGGYARFPLDYSQGFEMVLPHVQHVRYATRLLQLEFEVKSHRRDVPGALGDLRALFLCSRALRSEPVLVSQLVVFAVDGVAKNALAQYLCLLNFPETDLRATQQMLRQYDRLGQIRIALIGERAMGHSVMRNQSLANPKFPAKPALPSDAAYHLRFMNRFIAATELPFPDALKEAAAIEAQMKKDNEMGLSVFTHVISSLIVPATGAVFEYTARNIATDRAADAGIACELYRREQGKLPPTLDELVPQYLPSIPIDPFTGQPMIYKVDENGFKIYSLGKNKTDDGGRLDPKPGEDNRIRDEGLFFPTKSE